MYKSIKHFNYIFAVAGIVLSTALTIGLSSISYAASGSDTCVWTGGGSSNKFSTAANWSDCGGAVPVAGDIIKLPGIDSQANSDGTLVEHTLDNDLNVAFRGIIVEAYDMINTFSNYTLNNLHLADGAIIKDSSGHYLGQYITVTGTITADGSLVFDGKVNIWVPKQNTSSLNITNATYRHRSTGCGAGGGVSDRALFTFRPTGIVTIETGTWYAMFGGEASVIVQSGGGVSLPSTLGGNVTYGGNITFQGGGATQGLAGCGQQYSLSAYGNHQVTLSGTINLNGGDIVYDLGGVTKLKITGTINGSGARFKPHSDSTGTFINNARSDNSNTAEGTTQPKINTRKLTDSKPNDYLSLFNTITTLDGVRDTVYVGANSTLKGNGTMNQLTVDISGTVAPGHSPGKLTVQQSLRMYSGSTYKVELQTAKSGGYDQIVVGKSSDTTGNNVVLYNNGGAYPALVVSLYKGYNIKAGDKFTIIDNKSKTPVEGIFKNLPEGATIKAKGVVFKINYKGGDGNDVVLTAMNTPITPDAGLALATFNPLTTIAITTVLAGMIVIVARNSRLASVRKS